MEFLQQYRAIWVIDFEFHAPEGERPSPLCMVALNVATGEEMRLWVSELRSLSSSFFSAPDVLVVAFFASAEMGCFLALDYAVPPNLLDLYPEFRNSLNGQGTVSGSGLLGAAVAHGLDCIGANEKTEMRDLAMRGGPYTTEERDALLEYCAADVDLTARLFRAMSPNIDWPRALLRGQYMIAVARMEWTGIPIDTRTRDRLAEGWGRIQDGLISEIDHAYGVYDGRSFRREQFTGYLVRNSIAWSKLPSGQLALDDDTFREMVRRHPEISPLRELRVSLSAMRLSDLSIGSDGRNRTLLSPFRSRTSRNQPSNSRFAFGPATWLRGLIRPEPGRALAYVDWSQQEFGIAGALSGDLAMQEAYSTGDPYMTFAIQAGAAPPTATKRTHGSIREQFKSTVLAVQYGMGEESLAARIGQPTARGHQLMRLHRETYPTYWRWSEATVNHALSKGFLHTVFGWRIQLPDRQLPNGRSLMNFPMQANGAEMLRIACIRLTTAGINVCAPVHDALLIETSLDDIDDLVTETQRLMRTASADVLSGFELRSDAKIIRYPDRYMDERGEKMWSTVMRLLDREESMNP